MATYYVSHDSASTNWANATNINTPATVATAMANAQGGDFVEFLSGSYTPPNATSYEVPGWNPTNSGTNGNPITFRSYTRHGAVINDCANANVTGYSGFGAWSRNYITFDGFVLNHNNPNPSEANSVFVLANADNCIVKNCEGIGAEHSDHTNGCIIALHSGCTGTRIFNCTFHGMTADLTPEEAVVNASAVYFFESTDTEIYNCTVYDCNNGISWKTAPNNVKVYQNFIYNCSRAAFFPTIETTGTANWYIHHNVILNCDLFVDMEDSPAATATGMRIYNNTIYDSGAIDEKGIIHGLDGGNQPWRSTEFYNNVFSVGGSTRFLEIYDNSAGTSTFPTVLDYNCYNIRSGTPSWSRNATVNTTISGWRTTAQAVLTGAEANSITTSPSFTNAGGSNASDYQLAVGSPCIGTGSGGVDMGAWQGVTTVGNEPDPGTSTVVLIVG